MREELFDLIQSLATAEHQFSRNTKLFKAGDRVVHIHCLRSGEAHFYKKDSDIIIKRYSAPSIIAEASLFSDHYHCTCVAASRVETYSLAKTLMLEELRTNERLAHLWMEYLSHQIVKERKMHAVLSMKTVRERFEAFNLMHDDHDHLNLTNIARIIGVSREALYREVAKKTKPKSAA